jgi:hypothetical protein
MDHNESGLDNSSSVNDRSRLWRDCLPPEFIDEDDNIMEPAEQLVCSDNWVDCLHSNKFNAIKGSYPHLG